MSMKHTGSLQTTLIEPTLLGRDAFHVGGEDTNRSIALIQVY